jgi:hypothetical protein
MGRIEEPWRVTGIASVLVWAIAGLAPRLEAAPVDCHRQAAALRESLEVVAEAMIDGQPAKVRPLAERASTWWMKHRSAFGSQPRADGQVQSMVDAAQHGNPRDAARQAVQVATTSLGWCGGIRRTDDQLMLLDFIGMTAWLRARGADMTWPRGARRTTEALVAKLTQRRNTTLARRLRDAVAGAMATPVHARGDIRPASRLLDLVDVAERALR